MKKTLLAATALTGILLAGTAQAGVLDFFTADAPGGGFHAGDFLGHVRVIGVLPNVDAPAHLFVDGAPLGPTGKVDATQSIEPEADLSYFITDSIAVEAIAGTTKHSLHLSGTTANELLGNDNVNIGSARLLPPTITLKYYFQPQAAFSPYVGAGINYTMFFDTHQEMAAQGIVNGAFHIQDALGAAIQAGIDYNVAGNWYLNLDVKHIFLNTAATVTGDVPALGGAHVLVRANIDLDPTIVGFGVGYKF